MDPGILHIPKLNLAVCFKGPVIFPITKLNFFPVLEPWYTAYSIAEFYFMFPVPGILPKPEFENLKAEF